MFGRKEGKIAMEPKLNAKWTLVSSYFEEETFLNLFEEHDYLTSIVFFGSFMKGIQHEKSDIDIICVPGKSFVHEMNMEDKLGCLHGLHEDLMSNLTQKIGLDVKLQEVFTDGCQWGLSYHTDDLLCCDYEFGKGQIGQCAILSKDGTLSYSTL